MNFAEDAGGVVALVGGQPITIDQVLARLAAIKRGPLAPWLPKSGPEDRRSRRWVLRLLVTEAILRRQAGYPAYASLAGGDGLSANGVDPDEAAALAHATLRIFDEVTSMVQVSEEEVKAYYVRNLDRYQMPERRVIWHRLEADLLGATAATRRAAGGGAMGDRFELRRDEFSGPFEEAVFAAEVGKLIGPVASELGWHVAIVEAAFPAGRVPFERVRSEIESDLLAAARGRVFEQWLEGRRRALSVVIPGWGHPGDPSSPDFVHRH